MRYILQHSTKPGYYVCTDEINLIVCTFKQGAFNENQEFTILNDFPKENLQKLPTLMREMGEWLRLNHYDKLF